LCFVLGASTLDGFAEDSLSLWEGWGEGLAQMERSREEPFDI